MVKLEDICKATPNRAQVIAKANVKSLIYENGVVVGVQYEDKTGAMHKLHGPVVLATGGYAADFTSNSLLKKYRPDIYDLPTTNGDHCTGNFFVLFDHK